MLKKSDLEDRILALERDLDDATKEIAWLRQSIYGSEKVAKLEAELEQWKKAADAVTEQAMLIEALKSVKADLETEVELLKSRLVKAADKIADDDARIARLHRMQDGAFE